MQFSDVFVEEEKWLDTFSYFFDCELIAENDPRNDLVKMIGVDFDVADTAEHVDFSTSDSRPVLDNRKPHATNFS